MSSRKSPSAARRSASLTSAIFCFVHFSSLAFSTKETAVIVAHNLASAPLKRRAKHSSPLTPIGAYVPCFIAATIPVFADETAAISRPPLSQRRRTRPGVIFICSKIARGETLFDALVVEELLNTCD